MVPLDIVGEIADIDPAVLLRSIADVAHHLLSGSGPVFVGSMGCLSPIVASVAAGGRLS